MMTIAEVMLKIALLKFEPFSDSDWMSFQGCESDNPLIADDPEFEYVIWIVDGTDAIRVNVDLGTEDLYRLTAL